MTILYIVVFTDAMDTDMETWANAGGGGYSVFSIKDPTGMCHQHG